MKWALVTGAAKNIGAAICHALASDGYSIVLHYCQSAEEAEETAESCRQLGVEVELLAGDFSASEGVDEFIRRYKERSLHSSVLVNNVGNYLDQKPLETTQEQWQALFQTNVFAPAQLCRSLVPSLRQQGGRIINLGCVGLQRQFAEIYSTAYTATKDALWRLTCALAWDLAGDGVTVNMVSPGYVEGSVVSPSSSKSLPMGRYASAQEVARTVAFLVGPDGAYITGQNIEVAGGVRLR